MNIAIVMLALGFMAMFFWLSTKQATDSMRILFFLLGMLMIPVNFGLARILAVSAGFSQGIIGILDTFLLVGNVLFYFMLFYVVMLLIISISGGAAESKRKRQQGEY